ncbi:hypothetical protein B0T14DRAFT_571362 [Immersiella caudata]|uniref:Uncharacterized protein n=1 Tax=Immersiella caudata TaxID=314043 RepID=A0AA39U5M4_9PEZI|nr:hypothetical protein B0T14DRAFT_571362 [Immersiella caudata]
MSVAIFVAHGDRVRMLAKPETYDGLMDFCYEEFKIAPFAPRDDGLIPVAYVNYYCPTAPGMNLEAELDPTAYSFLEKGSHITLKLVKDPYKADAPCAVRDVDWGNEHVSDAGWVAERWENGSSATAFKDDNWGNEPVRGSNKENDGWADDHTVTASEDDNWGNVSNNGSEIAVWSDAFSKNPAVEYQVAYASSDEGSDNHDDEASHYQTATPATTSASVAPPVAPPPKPSGWNSPQEPSNNDRVFTPDDATGVAIEKALEQAFEKKRKDEEERHGKADAGVAIDPLAQLYGNHNEFIYPVLSNASQTGRLTPIDRPPIGPTLTVRSMPAPQPAFDTGDMMPNPSMAYGNNGNADPAYQSAAGSFYPSATPYQQGVNQFHQGIDHRFFDPKYKQQIRYARGYNQYREMERRGFFELQAMAYRQQHPTHPSYVPMGPPHMPVAAPHVPYDNKGKGKGKGNGVDGAHSTAPMHSATVDDASDDGW